MTDTPRPSRTSAGVTKDEFRAVMGSFAAGVTIVTTVDGAGVRHGLTVTAFSSLSADPPLCLICIDHQARSRMPLRRSGAFAVNILRASQSDLSSHFASELDHKFDGVDSVPGPATQSPLLRGALAWLECEVVDIYAGGDHDVFVGRLLATHMESGEPLVYWRGRYSQLVPAQEPPPR